MESAAGGEGGTVDALELESGLAPNGNGSGNASAGGSGSDGLESKRSYKVITMSLLLFLFYAIADCMVWIGFTNYYEETEDENDSYDDSSTYSSDEYAEIYSFAYPFATSTAMFLVALLLELYVWHTKIAPQTVGAALSSLPRRYTVPAVALCCIGSGLHVMGMVNYLDWRFGSSPSSEYYDYLRMLLLGYFWSMSLWSAYLSSLFWIGHRQTTRLIASSAILALHCVLYAPRVFYVSDQYHGSPYDEDERAGDEYEAMAVGLVLLAAAALLVGGLSAYRKFGEGRPWSAGPIAGSGFESEYTLCAGALGASLAVYLVCWALSAEFGVSGNVMQYMLAMAYGPTVICYDILSHKWTP